jgi:hypothetical protein
MKLTAEELTWVDGQLARYEIKFQEIYDELRDHILTAIENLRTEGDTRSIDMVFNGVVKQQFPGYWPFEEIVKQHRAAYWRKIRAAMWVNFKYYFTWQTVPLMLGLVLLSFYLPHTKLAIGVMAILLLIVSVTPVIYVGIKGRAIKTDKGKQSLVKMYVSNSSNYMMLVFNLLYNLIAMLARDWAPASFLNPIHYPPVIYMLLLIIGVVYCLSCVRLSRQEFKIA